MGRKLLDKTRGKLLYIPGVTPLNRRDWSPLCVLTLTILLGRSRKYKMMNYSVYNILSYYINGKEKVWILFAYVQNSSRRFLQVMDFILFVTFLSFLEIWDRRWRLHGSLSLPNDRLKTNVMKTDK